MEVIPANAGSASFFSWLALSVILLLASRWLLARRAVADFALSDDDAVVHLSLVKELRQNPFTSPDFSTRFLFSGTGYPWGFHLFFALTRIPLGFLERFGTVVAFIFDSLTLLLVALSLHYFAGGSFYWLLLFPLLRLFWGKSGRAHSFSERPFATFFGNLYLLMVFILTGIQDSVWALAIAVVAGSVVIFSSKFAFQAIVFFSLGFSIFFLSLEPLLILGLSLVSTAVITRGESVRILISSFRWSVFYRQFLQARTSKTNRNFYLELLRGPKSTRLSLAKSNPIVCMFLDNPFLLVALSVPLLADSRSSWNVWLMVGVGLVLAISAPTLTFLGEPGRYLEFAIIPVFMILVEITPEIGIGNGSFLTLAGIATLIIFVRELWKKPSISSIERVASMRDLRNWASGLTKGVVLANPGRLNLFLGYSNPALSFLWIHSAISSGGKREAFERLVPARYPKATMEIGWFVENYDLRYLVLEKNQFSREELRFRDSQILYSKCFENENFLVFELRRGS